MTKLSKAKDVDSCCPLTSNPRLRLATDLQTSAIKGNFPAGIAKPTLRPLFAAGITKLDQLTEVTEDQLANLHAIGSKAAASLPAALKLIELDLKQ